MKKRLDSELLNLLVRLIYTTTKKLAFVGLWLETHITNFTTRSCDYFLAAISTQSQKHFRAPVT